MHIAAIKATVIAGAALAGLGFWAALGATSPASPSLHAANDGAKVGNDPGGLFDGGPLKPHAGNELAAFSGGCFWGTERLYRHVKGVVATAVGYTGGTVDHPTYEQVCTHTTGHAETVLIEFNPKVVSYLELVKTFWENHDPTTPDRQGPDEGNNYRSAIWTFNPEQLREALASKARRQKLEDAPITTQIAPIGTFWPAEEYHQQYDEKTGNNTCPIPNRRKGG
jgi:peptide-methionine (S)-S-oxide reductase